MFIYRQLCALGASAQPRSSQGARGGLGATVSPWVWDTGDTVPGSIGGALWVSVRGGGLLWIVRVLGWQIQSQAAAFSACGGGGHGNAQECTHGIPWDLLCWGAPSQAALQGRCQHLPSAVPHLPRHRAGAVAQPPGVGRAARAERARFKALPSVSKPPESTCESKTPALDPHGLCA